MGDIMKREDIIKSRLNSAIVSIKNINNNIISEIAIVAGIIKEVIDDGNKIMLLGNGGSAADAQHFTAELIGKFYHDRKSLPAIALTTNTSIITSIANDYGYDDVFSRQIEGIGVKGDAIIGISTSGNSKNIIKALKVSRNIGIVTIGFTGNDGGEMKKYTDHIIKIPSTDTPRIQECHIIVSHIICEIVEESFVSKKY